MSLCPRLSTLYRDRLGREWDVTGEIHVGSGAVLGPIEVRPVRWGGTVLDDPREPHEVMGEEDEDGALDALRDHYRDLIDAAATARWWESRESVAVLARWLVREQVTYATELLGLIEAPERYSGAWVAYQQDTARAGKAVAW